MKKNNSQNLTQAKLWMLAVGAVLAEQNGYSHNDLYGGYQKTEKNISTTKHTLERDWGIVDRDTLMSSLNWLLEEGHRGDFLEARYFLSTLSESAQNTYLKELSPKSNKYAQYHLIKAYDKKLPQAGVLAWDFGRYVFLCRDGAFLEYISDEEAWELISKVSKIVKESYSSWREYGLAYMAGRQLWLNKLSSESTKWHVDYVSKLIFDKESPWYKVEWDTKLE